MNLNSYLNLHQEPLPGWLDRFKPADEFSIEDFLASRVVLYPGSRTDGHPVKLFGSTHSAHCFVYADYGVSQTFIEAALGHERCAFIGYKKLARIQLKQADITPSGWISHILPTDRQNVRNRPYFFAAGKAPFGFLEILEREPSFTDDHGAFRLAILFLGADGTATFDALFCQPERVSAPYALVLQDHGFGGNYSDFGEGGLLENIALRRQVFPRWLLVAQTTRPWKGYNRVEEAQHQRGGQHHERRFLYQR